METRKGEVITRQEIDAMDEEGLLALVRRHANLLGERFPKKRDQFYCPDILDEPHLLRKLYRLDRERFIGMVLEQNKREYISGGRWAAVLLSQGETLPEEVLRRQEQVMSKTLEHTTSLAIESALFLEVSEQARRLWQEHRYFYQKTRCDQLSQAMALREFWLGVSHTDSARVFYELGWSPLDVMLSFLLASPYRPAVDPDCAAVVTEKRPAAPFLALPGPAEGQDLYLSLCTQGEARAMGAEARRSSSRACWAWSSWVMEMMPLTTTMTRIITPSSQSSPPLASRDRAAAASSTRIMGSFSWSRRRRARLRGGLPFSSLGPYRSRRVLASPSERPR